MGHGFEIIMCVEYDRVFLPLKQIDKTPFIIFIIILILISLSIDFVSTRLERVTSVAFNF